MHAVALFLSTLALLATSSSRADEVNIGGCGGIVKPCGGDYNFLHYCNNRRFNTVSCHSATEFANITWYINGQPIDTTRTKQCSAGIPSRSKNGYSGVVYEYCLPNSSSIQIRELSSFCKTALFSIVCTAMDSAGKLMADNYSVCLTNEFVVPLFAWPNLLETETVYAKPGDVAALNCTYYFEKSGTPYNYSITWIRNTSDHNSVAGANSSTISCSDLGNQTFTSTLFVTADVADAQYSCRIATIENNSISSVVSKKFLLFITLQPRVIIVYPEITGISSAAVIVMVAIAYAVGRFLRPLKSRLHHSCNYGRRTPAGSTCYDAVVVFDENSSLTSSFAHNSLLPRVEGQWCYRLCMPQREFLPVEGMTEKFHKVFDQSLMCIFLIDEGFFDCHWCDRALQTALKHPGKAICVLFVSQDVVRLWKPRLAEIEKVAKVISWTTNEKAMKSIINRIFISSDNWTSLNTHLPPNRHLSCC